MNWDDLRILLAVSRAGSRAGAARLLDVDKSTVARRVENLEQQLDTTLTEQAAQGRVVLTAAGHRVAALAEEMEDRAEGIRQATSPGSGPAVNWVRVTAVPLLVNHILLPHSQGFSEAHPGIGLELIAEARDLSLVHRDADVALRLARPREGGQAVLARQIGRLSYAAYAAVDAPAGLPWIGYDRTMQYLSHAAAVSALAGQPGARLANIAVNDAEALFQAVLAGFGVSLFPRVIAEAHPGLRRVDADMDLPQREVWLLVRRDLRNTQRVDAVTGWLAGVFR